MKPRRPREQVNYWRPSYQPGLELLKASYLTHQFDRHSHDGYAVGVIEEGALGFNYRGRNVVAPAGAVNLAIPDEPHNGFAAAEAGWTYRMFYLDPEILRQAARQIHNGFRSLPFFDSGVIFDPKLARAVRLAHKSFEDPRASALERESRLLNMLTRLIAVHSEDRPVLRPVPHARQAVARVKEYIEDCHMENISLDRLARLAGLSPFHLTRVFRREVGLPPHVYLKQVRVFKARELLGQGLPIAEAAAEAGFTDQSHLSRQFKKLLGITPGQYRRL